MNKPTVYLCGPITGLSYRDATWWREYCTSALEAFGIGVLDPMRATEELKNEPILKAEYKDVMFADSAIVTRDRFDVMRCDMLFGNLLQGKQLGASSPGSMIEFGWADAYRKPIVTVMEKDDPHDKGMVRGVSGWIVDDLDKGLAIVRTVLLRG